MVPLLRYQLSQLHSLNFTLGSSLHLDHESAQYRSADSAHM